MKQPTSVFWIFILAAAGADAGFHLGLGRAAAKKSAEVMEQGISQSTASASGAATASLAVCSSNTGVPLFDYPPIATTDYIALRPLGWVTVPTLVFPAKQNTFVLAAPGAPGPRKAVYAPGKIWIKEIDSSEFSNGTQTDYSVYFYPCQEFKAFFGHIAELSPTLQTEMSSGGGALSCTSYITSGTTVTLCRRSANLLLNSGDLMGYSGEAARIDFSGNDSRITPLAFVNPAHYTSEMLYYVSPIDYFMPSSKADLETKLGSYDGTVLRTASPKSGVYMQDSSGTAQGNWFLPGLSLATPYQQVEPFIALVHEYVNPSIPLFSIGTSVVSLSMGVYSFAVQSSGTINRDFMNVTSDGNIYCYENFVATKTFGGVNLGNVSGAILLSLPTSTTLKIERQGSQGSNCTTINPWVFTSNAALFER